MNISNLPVIAYIVLGYLAIINLITFFTFGLDKATASAGKGHRRTPEKVLWLLALAGGSAGALFGMKTFRHKTKKISFQLVMGLIVFVQVGLLLGIDYLFGIIGLL